MLHLPLLQGQRVTLRAMADSDAPALFTIYGDPQVMQYTDEPPFPAPATVALMLQSVRRLLAQGASLEWAIVRSDSGALIGTCGLHSFDAPRRHAEIGCLLQRAAWGQGYMQEAVGLLLHYAAQTLALNAVSADIAPANQRAQRLFRKLGFQQTAPASWQRVL